jgi:hypothetical protein
MPKRFPPAFKRDVVAVARRGDLTVTEVAADFRRRAGVGPALGAPGRYRRRREAFGQALGGAPGDVVA